VAVDHRALVATLVVVDDDSEKNLLPKEKNFFSPVEQFKEMLSSVYFYDTQPYVHRFTTYIFEAAKGVALAAQNTLKFRGVWRVMCQKRML
jgi:hypothetical protein